MDIFYDAATKVNSQSIMAWKQSGKPVVGYTCSYTPGEIFYAANILPVRLRGIETEGTEVGDTYFGPFICTFPKCILQLAGKGKFSFLDGAIITPGCDGMRRLDECWRKAGEDYEGIVPDYFYYFDVPHKAEAHGMDWYIEEIKLLIKSVEDHFKVSITPDKLSAAISEFNQGRRLLRELEDLRAQDDVVVTGTDAFAATVAGTVMPRDEYTRELKAWITNLKRRKKALNAGKKRDFGGGERQRRDRPVRADRKHGKSPGGGGEPVLRHPLRGHRDCRRRRSGCGSGRALPGVVGLPPHVRQIQGTAEPS